MSIDNPEKTWSHWVDKSLTTYSIRDEITHSVSKRKNYQADVLESQPNLTTKGFQRLHAWAHMFGHEKADGIFWGHEFLNNVLQRSGIESEITYLRQNKQSDVKIFLTVEVERYELYKKIPFLKEVTYKLEAIRAGEREKTLYEISISQRLSKAEIKALVDGKKINGKEIRITPQRFSLLSPKRLIDPEEFFKSRGPRAPRGRVEDKAEGKGKRKTKNLGKTKYKGLLEDESKTKKNSLGNNGVSDAQRMLRIRNEAPESQEALKSIAPNKKAPPETVESPTYIDSGIKLSNRQKGTGSLSWKSNRATYRELDRSNNKGNRGNSNQEFTIGNTFSAQGRVVAGGVILVQALGALSEKYGEKKQKRKEAEGKKKAMRQVLQYNESGKIATIRKVTEVHKTLDYDHPLKELYVCWQVRSFKDKAELEGVEPAEVDRQNVLRKKKGKSGELYSDCRSAQKGYELKFYDQEIHYSVAGDFSGLIIGIYRPTQIFGLPSSTNESKFMRRELTFSFTEQSIPSDVIMTAGVFPENEILFLSDLQIRSQGKSLHPKKIGRQGYSFNYSPVYYSNYYDKKNKRSPQIEFRVYIEGSTLNYTYDMRSSFVYVPSDLTDKPAMLSEQFYDNGTKIKVLWEQQPGQTDPEVKPPLELKKKGVIH